MAAESEEKILFIASAFLTVRNAVFGITTYKKHKITLKCHSSFMGMITL